MRCTAARVEQGVRYPPPVLQEYFAAPGYICATWRNVIINMCGDALTMDALAAGREAGAALEREFGPQIGVLTIISSEMRMPTDEVRAQAAADMEASRHRLEANATVVEGKGFRASAFRTAYATLLLFSKSTVPSKVAGTVEEGASFILEKLGVDAESVPLLVGAVDECKRRLESLARE